MSTLPRQSAVTAFRPHPYASGAAALPRHRVAPAPNAPTTAKPVPVARPRQAAQTRWLLVLVAVAMLIVSAGMLYLSGHAQVTQEGYRRTKLLSALKQEQEKQQQAKQLKALAYTTAQIEHKARLLGMVPVEEKRVVTVGETTPAQLLQQALTDAATLAPLASPPAVKP